MLEKSLRMNSRNFEKSHNEGFRIYTKILVNSSISMTIYMRKTSMEASLFHTEEVFINKS